MKISKRVENILVRFPLAAAVLYVAVVAIFVFLAVQNVIDISDRRSAVRSASDILDQIEARRAPAPEPAAGPDVKVPAGSPFLEGATVSIAGAALLQRIVSATTRNRGNILSSQIDLQGSESKSGFIVATTSFEIEPALLQPLLYDLETGMPYLFVEQMVVQAPTLSTSGAGGNLRVQLSVSGQWQAIQ